MAGSSRSSSTSEILDAATKKMGGVQGEIALVSIRQGGLTKAKVKRWVKSLRNAADELEKLI